MDEDVLDDEQMIRLMAVAVAAHSVSGCEHPTPASTLVNGAKLIENYIRNGR